MGSWRGATSVLGGAASGMRACMRADMTICLATVTAFTLACSARDLVYRDGPVEIALTPYIGRLVTVTALAGNDTVRLLLDTGAGETVISPAVATRLGCRPAGRSIGFRMTGEKVEFPLCSDVTLLLGGVSFEHSQIGIFDVRAVLPAGVPPIDGVLSLKTLANRAFTLRLGQRRLTIESRSSFAAQTRDMVRLQSRIATGPDGDELTLFLKGMVDSGPPVWFLLDSGNLDRVQLAPHLTTQGRDSLRDGDVTLDGLGGIRTGLRTRDIIYDGVLSEGFLHHLVLTIDLAANAVWAHTARRAPNESQWLSASLVPGWRAPRR